MRDQPKPDALTEALREALRPMVREVVRECFAELKAELAAQRAPAETALPPLLTRAQCAELFSLSERTIDRMIAAGELDTVRVSGRARIPRASVERVMDPLGAHERAASQRRRRRSES